MKAQSKGKRTIQALADKILLHRLLENLGVPQMPILFSTHGSVDVSEVERLVESWEESGDKETAFDIVAKPTHLSNSVGSLIVTSQLWHANGYGADVLVDHMETYLSEKAHETES